jgi:hypothetical protein
MTKRDPLKVKEYNKMNYERDKDSILAKQKQYREENPDRIRERRKLYLETHKEQIKMKKQEQIVCECGVIICYGGKSKHIKTPKHKRLLEAKKLI